MTMWDWPDTNHSSVDCPERQSCWPRPVLICFSILIYLKMLFIPVIAKLNFQHFFFLSLLITCTVV